MLVQPLTFQAYYALPHPFQPPPLQPALLLVYRMNEVGVQCSLVTNLVTNLSPNLSPNLVITKFGDEFGDEFGDKFSEHPI